MASINHGWFSDNWFFKPPNPSNIPAFAYIGSRKLSLWKRSSSKASKLTSSSSSSSSSSDPAEPYCGKYSGLIEKYFWEVEARPDYSQDPKVDRILSEDQLFDNKPDATPEELEENREWWEEFKSNPVVKFLKRCEDIVDYNNQRVVEDNKYPYRKEDRDLWKQLPHVTGPDGRPMPRKSIKTRTEAGEKFWDFAKQFFFGLWGFRIRPYPPSRPIDVAQAIGYENLEKRYYDFMMKSGGWYYKDRLGRTRGPLELITLKTAWAGGVIDKNTFIWGEDMDEWAPIGMIYGLEKAIATWEVRLGAAATACIHKLQKGIPLWTPLKGFEKKSYKELQGEALESKRRDLAVLEANNGVWPGVKIPSHALFLWASGSDLTNLLEEDHMPNKFIPKDLRRRLAKIVPGLRPWEVLSIEQTMDRITYGGEWYRSPLGDHTTGPSYIETWKESILETWMVYTTLQHRSWRAAKRILPGVETVTEMFKERKKERQILNRKRFHAEKRAEAERANLTYTPPPIAVPVTDGAEPEPEAEAEAEAEAEPPAKA